MGGLPGAAQLFNGNRKNQSKALILAVLEQVPKGSGMTVAVLASHMHGELSEQGVRSALNQYAQRLPPYVMKTSGVNILGKPLTIWSISPRGRAWMSWLRSGGADRSWANAQPRHDHAWQLLTKSKMYCADCGTSLFWDAARSVWTRKRQEVVHATEA